MTVGKSLSGGLLTAALAVCFCAAMITPSRAQDAAAPAQDAAQAKSVTVTGCVSKAQDGSIQLAASDTTYTLSSTNADIDLNAQIGHTVSVTGTLAPAAPDAPADAPPSLTVSKLKAVSESCGQ